MLTIIHDEIVIIKYHSKFGCIQLFSTFIQVSMFFNSSTPREGGAKYLQNEFWGKNIYYDIAKAGLGGGGEGPISVRQFL